MAASLGPSKPRLAPACMAKDLPTDLDCPARFPADDLPNSAEQRRMDPVVVDPVADAEKPACLLSGASKMSRRNSRDISDFSPIREQIDSFLGTMYCEAGMGILVVFNVVVMIFEANEDALCDAPSGNCTAMWITITDYVLLVLYTLDCCLRIYVDRSHFPFNRWNLLDATIVISAYCDLLATFLIEGGGSPLLKIVRMLRVMRVMRVVKLFRPFPELYQLIRGFASTMTAIWWGFVMILVLLVMCSLLTVQLVQPDNRKLTVDLPDDHWCKDAFSSVQLTVLFFFQTLVAGDSWGACLIPLIRMNWSFFLIFSAALLVVQVGFVNLILSVIVDAAASAREEDASRLQEAKMQKEKDDLALFYEIMARIDYDQSGTVSLQELLDGFDMDPDLQARFAAMAIQRGDLEKLFDLMDYSGTGGLSYKEFVEHMSEAHNQDVRVQMMNLKLHMGRLYHMQVSCQTKIEEIHKMLVLSPRELPQKNAHPPLLPPAWQPLEACFEQFPEEVANPLKGILALEEELHRTVANLEEGFKFLPAPEYPHMLPTAACEDKSATINGINHKEQASKEGVGQADCNQKSTGGHLSNVVQGYSNTEQQTNCPNLKGRRRTMQFGVQEIFDHDASFRKSLQRE